MPNHIIGKENLPNVYIDNIVINDDSITAILCMYDQALNSTWATNQHMASMKIRVIATSNLDIANQINLSGSGIMGFQDEDLAHSSHKNITEFTSIETNDGMKKYEYEVEINVSTSDTSLLYLYACTMVDIDFFNNPQLNRYSGAVTGEKIFEGLSVPSESGYFYYPDTNEEYPGPVHLHNGEYMEGSRHTDNSHKNVRYVPETNAKITDERG